MPLQLLWHLAHSGGGLRVPHGNIIRGICGLLCILLLELIRFLVGTPAVEGTEHSGNFLFTCEGGSADERAVEKGDLVQETGH